MSGVQGTLAGEHRLRWLERRLGREGTVTIAGAAGALGVSEMTIRRDLATLEEQGRARRVRGGARAVGPQTFDRRRTTEVRAKARIARKLLPLVPTAGTVGFDASTTVMRLASGVDGAQDLTVVTNGPDTFATLQARPGLTPLLTGGRLDVRTGSLVGPLACRAASQLLVDRLFLSAAAVDADAGALEATLDEAEVKRALAAVAGQVVLAVDASKLDRRAPAVGVGWERIDVLVTDLDPGDPRLAPYRRLVEVL